MQYWIIIDNMQRGPMTAEDLATLPEVDLSTPVWYEDLPDWTVIGAVPETAAAVARAMALRGSRADAYRINQAVNRPAVDEMPPMPPTHLTGAILTTICCCLPLGIVAIIYASKVSPAYMRGDYDAALKASSRAELWVILAFVLGILIAPFQLIFSSFY